MRVLLLTFICLCLQNLVSAQAPISYEYHNSLKGLDMHPAIFNDSAKWDDPKKATVLALVLPGAGQIYNKKYLKAGIVYAGIGGLIYMYKYNSDSLSKYQTMLTNKIDGDSTTIDLFSERSEASVKSDRDFHRRYRDISILGFFGLYALQAIDANVDAHLKEFKVNKDLSMKVTPDIYAIKPGIGRYNGLTVSLRF
ncbi:MAG: DUF5683 domain-containing protein [Bacteroidia bacterium]